MKASSQWIYCTVMSAAIVIFGCLEILRIWCIGFSDPEFFGTGVMCAGLILMIVSIEGFGDSLMDEAQEELDSITEMMTLYSEGKS